IMPGDSADFGGVLTTVLSEVGEITTRYVDEVTEVLNRLDAAGELGRLADDVVDWNALDNGTNLFLRNSDSLGRPTRPGYGAPLLGEGSGEGPRLGASLQDSRGGTGPQQAGPPSVGGSTAQDIVSTSRAGRTVLDPGRSLADVSDVLALDGAWRARQAGQRIGQGVVEHRRTAALQQARVKWLENVSNWRVEGLDEGTILDRLLTELDVTEDALAGRQIYGQISDIPDARIAKRAGRQGILDEQLDISAELEVVEDFVAQWDTFPTDTLIRKKVEAAGAGAPDHKALLAAQKAADDTVTAPLVMREPSGFKVTQADSQNGVDVIIFEVDGMEVLTTFEAGSDHITIGLHAFGGASLERLQRAGFGLA
ncbi:hypothetical protein LCGC14_2986960, partial [marine sediment metagenome]